MLFSTYLLFILNFLLFVLKFKHFVFYSVLLTFYFYIFLFTFHVLLFTVFSSELLKKTSGNGTAPQLQFSHWETLTENPFWRPTTVEELEVNNLY